MYKDDLALNKLQWLICYETQPNQILTREPNFITVNKKKKTKH